MDIELRQRGRASMDFLVSFGRAMAISEARLNADIKRANIVPEDLPDDLEERNTVMENALARSHSFHMRDLVIEWTSTRHGLVVREAIEEIMETLEPQIRELADGSTKIVEWPHFTPPDYLKGLEIYRTAGGWDGHPHQGRIPRLRWCTSAMSPRCMAAGSSIRAAQ